MTSYLEGISQGMHVQHVQVELNRLREKDRVSRGELVELNKREAALLERLKEVSKNGPDFDEEPLKAEYEKILSKRQEVLSMLEDQMKAAQQIYERVDNKIKYFDNCAKKIGQWVPAFADPGQAASAASSGDQKKKKQKTGSKAESAAEMDAMAPLGGEFDEAPISTDPNEPVYCYCRRVSFGQMVGCENMDCTIEWFHFKCVGLNERDEPPPVWYCPTCRKQMEGDKSEVKKDTDADKPAA